MWFLPGTGALRLPLVASVQALGACARCEQWQAALRLLEESWRANMHHGVSAFCLAGFPLYSFMDIHNIYISI